MTNQFNSIIQIVYLMTSIQFYKMSNLNSPTTAEFSPNSLAMVQLILLRPEPIQVQSHIIPSFDLS